MGKISKLPVKKKMLKKFKDTVGGITFVASDTKKLVRTASDGDIEGYCQALKNYKLKFSRDYSIVLLIFSPIVVAVCELYKYAEKNNGAAFDESHERIYKLVDDILKNKKSDFGKLCEFIGKGEGENIAKILKEKLLSHGALLSRFSENKYGHKDDALMKRIEEITPWAPANKKYINNKVNPFIRDALGSDLFSRIKRGLSSSKLDNPGSKNGGAVQRTDGVTTGKGAIEESVPIDERKVPEETKKKILGINEVLKRRKTLLAKHKKADGTRCKDTYEELKTLLEGDSEGAEDISDLLDEDYCEWKTRLTERHYSQIQEKCKYENYALMNIAHSLRLAKAEGYDASSEENNELMSGRIDIDVEPVPANGDTEIISARLYKVIVEDEDILRSAQRHFVDLELKDRKFGFLNAGDPYDPNGFLPNYGSALEEYLSMNTTLCRDLSHKKFRREGDTAEDAFYTERKKAFPPIVDFDGVNKGAWERLTGAGRDFYHERGLMSKNVYLTRNLGDCSKPYRDDETSPWRNPKERCDDFDVDRESGLGSKPFYVMSIAGLEDRSTTLLTQGGDGHTAEEYQKKWKDITMKQCEFVLRAFRKEKVQVLFLCAFGAGCFGGSASIVAACFKELLIEKGYIDLFDMVVFPIGYDKRNFNAFNLKFKKLN